MLGSRRRVPERFVSEELRPVRLSMLEVREMWGRRKEGRDRKIRKKELRNVLWDVGKLGENERSDAEKGTKAGR